MTKIDDARVLAAIRDAETASGTRIAVHVAHHHVGDVLHHAQKAFHGKGMHHIDNGNAVLFTVAPKSRKLAVYGGRVVHERLGEPFWTNLIDQMAPLFAQDRPTEALVRGIEILAGAMQEHKT